MKRGIQTIGCAMVLLLAAQWACAQSVVVRASVNKKTILLGEPLLLTLETETADNSTVAPFQLHDIPHFDVLQKDSTHKEQIGNLTLRKQYYTITSFDSGQWTIPAFALLPGVKTQPITITVAFSNPFNAAQPYHDIQDVKSVPATHNFEQWWYLIAGVLLVLTIMMHWFSKKRKPTAHTAPHNEHAYKRVLNELTAIQKKERDSTLLYAKMVQLFRTYLQERTTITSLQQTSDDVIKKMQPLFSDALMYDTLSKTLQVCDGIKFAKYKATPNEAAEAYTTITNSIHHIEQHVKATEKNTSIETAHPSSLKIHP